MRLAISPEHRDFFNKNHFIAFEELLPLDQVAQLRKHAQGDYDLWRHSEAIKKITHKHTLAAIASELFQTIPLRYGFDLYITAGKSPWPPCTLQQISALSPLAGALVLPLQDLPLPIPFPGKEGSGLFISPSFPIPWPELFATPDLQLLMIAYAQDKTSFRADIPDLHATQLKKLGYVFNDVLKDSLHPVLIRKN